MRLTIPAAASRHGWCTRAACFAPGLLAAALLCLAFAQPARAQTAPVLDHFTIGVGSYYATSSTTLGVGAPHGLVSASVNLEDNLGFDASESLPRVRIRMLVGKHQGLSVDYYRYSRAKGRHWQRTVFWQGKRYDLDARLHGRVSFAFGSLAWRWWFGTGNNVFGLGFGASHYRASASAHGTASVNGKSPGSIDLDTGTSAWAPLLRVGWRHAFNRHWRMYFDAAGVFKGGGDLRGHIINASLGVEWMPVAHFGVALEYGVNSIHIQQSREDYNDSLDLELYGPSAFVYLRF